jgi:diguanylate cyclase (GGDEF)-like protein/PAS domain S-box-containing protein
LADKKTLKLCVNRNDMPLEGIENNHFIGLGSEIFELLQKHNHFTLKMVATHSLQESITKVRDHQCDIIPLTMVQKDPTNTLRWSFPYLHTPLVVVTKNKESFINNIHTLQGKKLAVLKGAKYITKLHHYESALQLIEVTTLQEALEGVEDGKYYGFIGSLLETNYSIQRGFAKSLKISAKLPLQNDYAMGISKEDPLLFSVMQKTLHSLSENQKQHLINNWTATKYLKSKDWDFVIELSLFTVLIVGVFYLLYRKEKKIKEEVELHNNIFTTIINSISHPIFYKDISGVYKNVNHSFAKDILGLERENVIGKTLDQLYPIISKEEIAFYKQQDEKLYKDGNNQLYEASLTIKSGKKVDYRIQKELYTTKDGKILGYVGFMYDITELKNKQRNLEHLTLIDPMTQLYNRRYLENVSEIVLQKAKEKHTPISILMFDIDDFKHVNDTYGHDMGDNVIITIANILQKNLLSDDIGCRYGGEEFLALLHNKSLKQAIQTAQTIRKTVEKLEFFTQDKHPLKVTISIGVVEVDSAKTSNLQKSFKRADEALYRAKNNGKNRVEFDRRSE